MKFLSKFKLKKHNKTGLFFFANLSEIRMYYRFKLEDYYKNKAKTYLFSANLFRKLEALMI